MGGSAREAAPRAGPISVEAAKGGPWRSFGSFSGVVSPREARRRSGGGSSLRSGGRLLRDQQVQRELRGLRDQRWSRSPHLHVRDIALALVPRNATIYGLSLGSVKRRAPATRRRDSERCGALSREHPHGP